MTDHYGLGHRIRRHGFRDPNQDILYRWSLLQFPTISDGGSLIMPKPAPLTEAQIREVWAVLEDHPKYRGFKMQSTTEEGNIITNKEQHHES